MTEPFVFRSPTRLVFGAGSVESAGAEALAAVSAFQAAAASSSAASPGGAGLPGGGSPRGAAERRRLAFLVTGKGHTARSAGLARLRASLERSGFAVELYAEATADPPVELVLACAEGLAASGASLVVAYGGGSPIDCAKAASVYAANTAPQGPFPGAPFLDFLYGRLVFSAPGLPLMAVPTTAGSGSEMSAAAVTTDLAASSKRGLSSDFFFPRAALVDPELQATMPPALAAATGMDALTHAIESFASLKATPLTRAIAGESARLIAGSLERAVAAAAEGPGGAADLGGAEAAGAAAIGGAGGAAARAAAAARADMALASAQVAMAFSQTGLGMVHGFAHPVGARAGVAHGVANAVLLPYVMEACAEAAPGPFALLGDLFAAASPSGEAEVRAAGEGSLGARRGGLASGLRAPDRRAPEAERAAYAVGFVRELSRAIGIPARLRELGVDRGELPAILADAISYRGRGGSPRAFTDAELGGLLERAY